MLDKNTIIRILLLIVVILFIVLLAPKNAGQEYTSDITVLDHYSNNIYGFEFATDIVVLHVGHLTTRVQVVCQIKT